MRELTPEEVAFLEEKLAGKKRVEAADGEVLLQELPPAPRRRRVYFFQQAEFWAIALLVAPALLLIPFVFFLLRLENLFGKEVLASMEGQVLPEELLQQFASVGFEDLPFLLDLYAHRGLIIAGVFTFFIGAATLLMVGASLWRRRRERKVYESIAKEG